jgi:protein involved in polysaccharide export with SLBB domain
MYQRSLRLTIVAILLAVPPALAQSSAPGGAEVPREVPRFSVGDGVRITVWRNPELSGQFEVAEDGTIIHPLYRTIRVAGVPVPQVEAEVRRVLERFETAPELVVEPLFRVAIGGQVRSPNIYTLPPYTTIAQAVTQAGGVTEAGRVERVRLLRDGETLYLDLSRPHSELENLRVRSGDQIIVDPRRRVWRDQVQPAMAAIGSVASLTILVLRLTGSW